MPRSSTRHDNRPSQRGRLVLVERGASRGHNKAEAPVRQDRAALSALSSAPPSVSSPLPLAVHKRKVGDVRAWLTEALDGAPSLSKYRRILILTGPAGAGKTATLRALAGPNALHFDIAEWLNHETFRDEGETRSACEQFDAFLHGAARFGSLALAQRGAVPHARSNGRYRRVILVEDWPNLSHEDTRHGVHRAIERFLEVPGAPLVLIVSDTVPRSDTEVWDATLDWRARKATQMDVRTAVPESVRLHPACTEIRFNSLTTRMIQSALSVQAPHIPQHLSASIAEDAKGDIRQASTAAEMYTLHKWKEAGIGGDSALALFHALGRVLFNKRAGDPEMPAASAESGPTAPPWFVQRRASMVDVEALWTQLPVDASTFQLYLHHNLLAFVNDTDEALMALDAMSWADTMHVPLEVRSAQSYAEQYAYEGMTRGTLLALPSPVQRRGQQLTKPALWDVLERTRACQDVLSHAHAKLMQSMRTRCDRNELATFILPLAARCEQKYASLVAPLLHFEERTGVSGAAPHDELDAADVDMDAQTFAMDTTKNVGKPPTFDELMQSPTSSTDTESLTDDLDDLDQADEEDIPVRTPTAPIATSTSLPK